MTERRKTGRPRKAAAEQRSERLSGITLTTAERQHVEAMAARFGLPVMEFCRRVILSGRVAAAPARQESRRLLVELNRVGVNLNQIARAVNRGRDLPADFPAVLAEIRAVIAEVADDGS